MEPSNFIESNAALNPPEGVGADQVEPIFAWRGQYGDGTLSIITCWKPTKEELEEIQRTGRVWVEVLGGQTPPLYVNGHNPFERKNGT